MDWTLDRIGDGALFAALMGWYLTITGDQLLERPSAQQGARPSATTISGTAYPISDHSVEL